MNNSAINEVHRQASIIIREWRNGQTPDATRAIQNHPSISRDKSLVLELAYEEYCLREAAGERLEPEQYCLRFPQFQESLSRLLQVHSYFRSHSLGIDGRGCYEWPEIGQTWLDWNLLKLLGTGAFSRVYLAHESKIGNRLVVVKCTVSGDEAGFLGRLSHPHIVPIHSVKEDSERNLAAICMPFLGDATLEDILEEICSTKHSKPITTAYAINNVLHSHNNEHYNQPQNKLLNMERLSEVELVTKIMSEVAQGLAAAHSQGIRHGDIKPSNIILGFDGTPMLVDFNLSTDSSCQMSRIGGTPPYLAPECLRLFDFAGNQQITAELSLQDDIFSFGVVLYELLTHELPFKFDDNWLTQSELHADAIRQNYQMPQRPLTIDLPLWEIVRKCLAFEPSERFESAVLLSEHLSAYLEYKRKHKHNTVVAYISTVTIASAMILLITMLLFRHYSIQLTPSPTDNHSQIIEISSESNIDVSKENSAVSLLRAAIESIEKREFSLAVEQLSDVHQTHPTITIKQWLGYLHAKLGHYPRSINYLREVLQSQDNCAEIHNNLGYCYSKTKKWEEAELELNAAIRINPELQAPWYNRGILYSYGELQRPKNVLMRESLHDFEMALKSGPETAMLHFHIAQCVDSNVSESSHEMQLIKQHLARALDLGLPEDKVKNSSRFANLSIRPKRQNTKLSSALMLNSIHPEQLIAPFNTLEEELLKIKNAL